MAIRLFTKIFFLIGGAAFGIRTQILYFRNKLEEKRHGLMPDRCNGFRHIEQYLLHLRTGLKKLRTVREIRNISSHISL